MVSAPKGFNPAKGSGSAGRGGVDDALKSGGRKLTQREVAVLGSEEIMASQMPAPGVLGTVESVAAAPSNMLVLGGGAAAGWLGEKLAASAKKREWGTLEKVGNVMATPKRWYGSWSFGDISEKLGVKGMFTKVAQPVANGAGAVADKVGGWTGYNNWRSNAHLGKAASAHNNAVEIAKGMQLEHAPTPEIRSAMQNLRNTVVGTSHHSHINAEKFAEANAALKEAMEAHKGKIAGEAKTLVKSAEKLGTKIEDAVYHGAKSAGYKNVRENFKSLPEKISKEKAGPGLMHASFVALSALSMASDTKSFSHNLKSLKQMYLDMTGEKDVSTARLLIGSVPAPVANARSALVKNYGIKTVLDAINIGLNVKMNRMSFMKSTVAFMGVGMLSSGVDSMINTSVMPFYKGISDAHRQGRTISAEAYAEFLTLASKDMGTRGKDDAAVRAVAEQFAAEQIAPAAILKEVENGKIMVRVHSAIAANEAKAPVSQVDKLQGKAQAAQPVVGGFTAKEAAKAQAVTEQGRAV